MLSERIIIEKLIGSSEFRELQSLGSKREAEKKQFDLLSVFDELIDENAWSRLFAYLFDSKKEHGLKQTMFRKWLQHNSKANKKISTFISQFPNQQKSETITITEYVTENNRRIDIVVKLNDSLGKTKAVVGIENKVNSGEQFEQIGDYQKSLIKDFPEIPKILFFLTPDGRQSFTSNDIKECPCFHVSYSSILATCNEVIPTTEGQAETFLKVLKTHINNLVKNDTMDKKIQVLIHKLYENKNHREAIKLLGQYSPSTRNLFDEVTNQLKNTAKLLPFKRNEIEIEYYPATAGSNPHEYKLCINELTEITGHKGFKACYMLDGKKTNPQYGSEFTLRLLLWCENDVDDIMIQDMMKLPKSLNNERNWSGWNSIWVGESHTLSDMGNKDIQKLSNILISGIKKTYSPLKKNLIKLAKSRIK